MSGGRDKMLHRFAAALHSCKEPAIAYAACVNKSLPDVRRLSWHLSCAMRRWAKQHAAAHEAHES